MSTDEGAPQRIESRHGVSDADDAVPGDGRFETATEKSDRNWTDILQELRATQTGTQILTGFLLAVAFQPMFQTLDAFARTFYLCLVTLAGIATLLGLTPIIMHRRLFRHHEKARLVVIGNVFLLATLAVVSLLVAGVAAFLFGVTAGLPAGAVALGVTLAAVAVIWFAVPRLGRTPS
ncbi:DUF6328 family protein [Microbacterium ginsengisoli]|uniref:DUF6328 family protein n=1 Tax=Microbacterium ginsengisoli TaxID=400772 RepID=UPI001FE1ACBE|nr:DUF6328 family protein [Microbacterium ginsengisoli]